MKRLVLMLGLFGCAANPTMSAGPATDLRTAACQQNAYSLRKMYCERQQPSPLPPGYVESFRRSYEGQKNGCAPEAAPLEACVLELEAIAAAQDPAAKERRAAAKPNAEATRNDVAFKRRIEQWLAIFDQLKIICAHQKSSPAYARECSRAKTDLDGVEVELRGFLQARGFDMRDVGELGLWPSDPDGLGG